MMEKHPQMSLATQALRNFPTSGPSSRAHDRRIASIDSPWRAYSGKPRGPWSRLCRALATRPQMRSVCRARSSGDDDGALIGTQPDDHAIRRLVETA